MADGLQNNVAGGEACSEAPLILAFQRRLTRAIAGGARSVFDRGAFLSSLGYRVVFFIMDKTPNHGQAISALRKDGILHPSNDLIFISDLLETHQDRMRALTMPSLFPDVPCAAMPEVEERHNRIIARRFNLDGVSRHTIRYFLSGEIRRQNIRDAHGRLIESWVHDANGTVLYIDGFDPNTDGHLSRKLVCAGRYVFCEIDMSVPLGLGAAKWPGQAGEPPSFARLIAERLEQRYEDEPNLLMIADGENTSQNVLRAFTPGKVRGISVLHNNHTEFPHTPDAPIKEAWDPFLNNLNNVRKVVTLTSRQQTDLAQAFPDMPLVKVNHPTLPVAVPTVTRDPNLIVFVGRLSHQKRLDHLVEVFAHVAKARPGTKFEIYGGGDKLPWLKSLIEDAGLSTSVSLCGFTENPLEAFARASLTVMTSYFEGLPLTILEAMSVGTPFVAYDLNYGPAEVIQDGIDGVLVENGNIAAAGDAIVALLNDPERLKAMSRAASSVGDRFTMAGHKDIWHRLIQDISTNATIPLSKDGERDDRPS